MIKKKKNLRGTRKLVRVVVKSIDWETEQSLNSQWDYELKMIKFKISFFIEFVLMDVTFQMRLTLINLKLCNFKYKPKSEKESKLT